MKSKIFVIFIFLNIFLFGMSDTSDYKVIESTNVLLEAPKYIDINTATFDELRDAKISKTQAKNIIDYRNLTGGFENIYELRRIKGIGPATYKKLKSKLVVRSNIRRKPLFINKADKYTLKLFGFNKKDIKNILKYRTKNGNIKNNLDFKKIVNKKTYRNYVDIVKYDNF